MSLGIYLVYEKLQYAWQRGGMYNDSYDAYVVMCDDIEEAKTYIEPWWKDPQVECIGEALEGKKGIVLGSYNSTG
jgi:hypothetical protein